MLDFIKGFKKAVCIADQSDYTTKATTGWKFWEVDNENIGKNVPEVLPVGLRGGFRGYTRRLQGPIDITGTLVGDIHPEGGLPLIFKAALGSVSSAQLGSTAAYKHTFSIVEAIAYGSTAGLTIKTDRDQVVYDNYGIVVPSFTLNSASGNTPAKVSVNILGKDQDAGVTQSPVLYIVNPFMHHDASGGFMLDSSSVDIQSWSITLDNNYKTDIYANNASRLKIPPNGFRNVTGNIVFPVIDDLTPYNKFIAGSPASLIVTYTGALIEAPYSYQLIITMPEIYYTGPVAPGSGGVETPTMECPFRCFESAAGVPEIQIDIVSTETSI